MEDTIAKFTDETVQSLIELGRQTAGPQSVEGGNVPFAVVDGKVVSLEGFVFNEHSARPERIKQAVKVLDPASFVAYYGLFSNDQSRVFADESARSVVAVLDYHEASEAPRWGSHRVTLTLRESEEWKVWAGCNNRQMTQQQFAEFLEQNAMDISVPAPARIMEVARDLEATTESEFGAGLRMSDGQVKFRYSETVKARVGSGEVAVPDQFSIAIPVFVGGNPQSMDALLRFRTKEGKLTFWYTLVRPEAVQRAAFTEARNLIASELEIVVLNGSPD